MTPEDAESRRVWAEGFIVKESSRLDSNWRSRQQVHDYLQEAKIVGIEGLDTRALTRHLREHGSQQGIITPYRREFPPGCREGTGSSEHHRARSGDSSDVWKSLSVDGRIA